MQQSINGGWRDGGIKKGGCRGGSRAVGAVPGVATGRQKADRPTIECLAHPVSPAPTLSIISSRNPQSLADSK